MHATPDLSHLTLDDYAVVYEPAEDTFLLMDALQQDLSFIMSLRPAICVEVGSGSGAVCSFLAKLIGSSALYLCTDINRDAALTTQRTGHQNHVALNAIVCDLMTPFCERLRHSIDVLIFNPPYVVTAPEEVGSRSLAAAWAGGSKGRDVMDRLFVQVPQLLSKNGVFYAVIVKENNQDEIQSLFEELGFEMNIVLSRRCGAERLTVLKFTRH